jgi:hypothetical protein
VGTGDKIYRYDGTTMTKVSSGEPSGNPAGIDWKAIHGTGANDIWAVGSKGRVTHFNGQSWIEAASASVSTLDDVWVSPDGSAWAVGESGTAMRYTPGGRWQDIAELTLSTVQWKSVTGTSSSDVWVASYESLIYHFDGTQWRAVTGVPSASPYIHKLWALGPNDVWGAAEFGGIVHWDGVKWLALDVRLSASLHGIWMAPGGEGWVVGDGGTVLHRRP